MSTLDSKSFKDATSENRKEMIARITQYKAVLQQAEYIYITTDAILNKGCAYLWPLLCSSGILHPSSLILVAPALKVLTELAAYKDAQSCRGGCVTLGPDADRTWEKPEYFSDFKFALERKRRSSAIGPCLHLMMHPDDEWNDSGNLSSDSKEDWGNTTEKQAIQQAVFSKHQNCSQIVISQDVNFLRELHTLCNSTPGESNLITLVLDDAGYLADPFDSSEGDLLTKISANKLKELAGTTPLYIDDSALKHPQAVDFLNRIKPVLISTEKQLSVLTFKHESLPQSDLLMARAQETPCTVRFSWLDEEFDKTNALIAALLAESARENLSHIALVTDRVARAEKIMARVAGTGLLLDVYSINRFGFLSCRARSQNMKKSTSPLQRGKNNERMEAAIRAGNISEVQSLASNAETWEAGVMTCLCQNNTSILETLVNQADRVSSRMIRWIITEFRQFQKPTYLMENPKVYELIVQMLSKTTGFPVNIADQLYEHLCDIDDDMTASHAELEYLASLFRDARVNAVGAAMPMARIRRSMLTDKLPHSEVNPKLALELQKKEVEWEKAKIRVAIARLQKELSQLEEKNSAIVADLQSYRESDL